MILERVSPVTHSIGNSLKRVIVIVASIIIFKNPVSQQNIVGKQPLSASLASFPFCCDTALILGLFAHRYQCGSGRCLHLLASEEAGEEGGC